MLIESVIPLRVKLQTGDIRLLPGFPVEMPTAQAQQLLARAPGKVREALTDWLTAWRELASLTSGMTEGDSRLPLVMGELDRCDDAYLSGDWVAFRQAAARVRSAMEGRNVRAEP